MKSVREEDEEDEKRAEYVESQKELTEKEKGWWRIQKNELRKEREMMLTVQSVMFHVSC
jgi:hypothetical protein